MRYWSTGGGGYGDPLSRPSELVAQDVLDGRVSSGEAQRSYGVVLDGTGEVVAETSELRQRLHLAKSNQSDAQTASAGTAEGA